MQDAFCNSEHASPFQWLVLLAQVWRRPSARRLPAPQNNGESAELPACRNNILLVLANSQITDHVLVLRVNQSFHHVTLWKHISRTTSQKAGTLRAGSTAEVSSRIVNLPVISLTIRQTSMINEADDHLFPENLILMSLRVPIMNLEHFVLLSRNTVSLLHQMLSFSSPGVNISCRSVSLLRLSSPAVFYFFNCTSAPFTFERRHRLNPRFYTQSAHLFSGWQLSLISWGLHWTNRRKGVCFLWLLVEGRHLVAFRSRVLGPGLFGLVAAQIWTLEAWRGCSLCVQDSGWKNKC